MNFDARILPNWSGRGKNKIIECGCVKEFIGLEWSNGFCWLLCVLVFFDVFSGAVLNLIMFDIRYGFNCENKWHVFIKD